MRIAKRMGLSGLCSRREAEDWILNGRVKVNGNTLKTPACIVGDDDKILVDGKPIPPLNQPRLWRFHKPNGVMTTTHDPMGRPTIYDVIPPTLPRVMPVGRLDINSEGLLLLTNHGGLKRELEHPKYAIKRTYRVRVFGRVNTDLLKSLQDGITIDGVRYRGVEATLDNIETSAKAGGSIEGQKSKNTWLTMTLQEGKNREIRKICQHFGLQVNRLIRVSYGGYDLGNLARGAISETKV